MRCVPQPEKPKTDSGEEKRRIAKKKEDHDNPHSIDFQKNKKAYKETMNKSLPPKGKGYKKVRPHGGFPAAQSEGD